MFGARKASHIIELKSEFIMYMNVSINLKLLNGILKSLIKTIKINSNETCSFSFEYSSDAFQLINIFSMIEAIN
jgi:hypothetical protein